MSELPPAKKQKQLIGEHSSPLFRYIVLQSTIQYAFFLLSFSFADFDEAGSDSNGKEYESLRDLWDAELGDDESKLGSWYKQGDAYWKDTEATLDGVLGGFAHISPIDIRGSKQFLKEIKCTKGVAVDCGAGIGRVAKELLCPIFKKVDVLVRL